MSIDKYKKYEEQYKKSNIYWGIGIENEVYLEFSKKNSVSKTFFINNHKKERYSVDYYSNYKKEFHITPFETYFNNIIKEKESSYEIINKIKGPDGIDELMIEVPILFNAHSFEKTDINNQPKTVYSKENEPNPNFSGKTFIEVLKANNLYFTENQNWLFDGDTIEFINVNFHNKKLFEVIDELSQCKKEFIFNLNSTIRDLGIELFNDLGDLKIMEKNHPFAVHMTNLKNLSIFNNGTLHYNITIPTELDENFKIKEMNKFVKENSKIIKLIQWMEPLIIAIYGSKDIFSNFDKRFSSASQRCAVSRYIGIGTYDCNKMETGKILKRSISSLPFASLDYWWYNRYYESNAYNKLDEIGMDINFNKHYNHGIEIRFLDHISDTKLIYKSFEFIIYLIDYALENDFIHYLETPAYSRIWNNIVYSIMINGPETILDEEAINLLNYIFNCKLENQISERKVVSEVYNAIHSNLKKRFSKIEKISSSNYKKYIFKPIGKISKNVLEEEIIEQKWISNLFLCGNNNLIDTFNNTTIFETD